jgi:hypothetical protein
LSRFFCSSKPAMAAATISVLSFVASSGKSVGDRASFSEPIP